MKLGVPISVALSLLLGHGAEAKYFDKKKILNPLQEDLVIPGEYNVVFRQPKGELASKSIGALADEIKPEGVKIHSLFSNTIQGFAAKMTDEEVLELANNDLVSYIEPNMVVRADEATWGIDRVDQRDLPLNDSYDPNTTSEGEDVYAYILDTGVWYTHEEFDNDRAYWGTNTSGDGEDRDCHGHGTHVAGTVGGKDYGVAKKVNIVAVKVLTCSGSGSTAGVIAGVEWAMNDAQGKKATANMSLGGGHSQALNDAVAALHQSGVITVVAAGNDNGDACNMSPASEPAVITVGSTTNTDARSGFSNFGTCLDIFAPGSSITAAWTNGDDEYKTISGTSMASPHVCGGAALLLGDGVPTASVEQTLKDRATVDKVTDPKAGSPNLLLFVGETGPTQSPTPIPPTPAPTPCASNDVMVKITTDNYPDETSWTVKNSGGAEVGGRSSFPSGGTLYEDDLCLPNGSYEFTISDSYGDGICCSYGSGSYQVLVNGVEKAQGGSFGSSETKSFTASAPTAAPTNAVVDSPSAFPTALTRAPVSRAPVTPSSSPVAPTVSPVTPTSSPSASPTEFQGTPPPTTCRGGAGFPLPFHESFNSYDTNAKHILCWDNDRDFNAGILIKGGNNKHVRLRKQSQLSADFDVSGVDSVKIQYRRRTRKMDANTNDEVFIGYSLEGPTEYTAIESITDNDRYRTKSKIVSTENVDKLYLTFDARNNAKAEFVMLDWVKVTEV